jgi:N-acetylglucosamine-6-phosphate deacetylase
VVRRSSFSGAGASNVESRTTQDERRTTNVANRIPTVIVLSGATLVLPDRLLSPGTLVIDDGRIAEIRPDAPSGSHPSHFAFHGHYIVPGFVDVHVHGVEGIDSLDAGDTVSAIAERLPRYGVTAFCPTTMACAPDQLRRLLEQVRRARAIPKARAARVLPAHLESNFVNPQYRGAQAAACLRAPASALAAGPSKAGKAGEAGWAGGRDFTGAEILAEIERAAPDVGIVTLAPELDGGLDLIRWLTHRGHRASLGHSAATFDQATAAIAAGARQATHLFNRMPPLDHRAPGLAGAVLQSDEVAAEIICDAAHVHPAMVRAAIAAKQPSRVMAITDATAAAGLARGAHAALGGQPIVAGDATALLADGTIAGSIVTMDQVFRTLTGRTGQSLVDAAIVCSTTPARELGLVGYGVLAPDASADLAVLDDNLTVVQTYVGGHLVYARNTPAPAAV